MTNDRATGADTYAQDQERVSFAHRAKQRSHRRRATSACGLAGVSVRLISINSALVTNAWKFLVSTSRSVSDNLAADREGTAALLRARA